MYPSYASQITFKYFTEYVGINQYRRYRYQARLPLLPGICRMSNKLYVETVQEFLRSTKFVSSSIDNNTALTEFLGSVPGGFECVRELYFDYFSRLKSTAMHNMNLELAVRCTSLRELKIMMHNLEMGLRTVQAAWTYYIFDRLLGCRCLIKVTIYTMGWYDPVATGNTLDLSVLIEQGFAALGQTVVVEVS